MDSRPAAEDLAVSGARPNPMPGRRIGEHGVIGDLQTCALVASDGTLDYLCWPNLDSATVFAALLDPAVGGEFSLAPDLADARRTQSYLPDTNVLATRWTNDIGSAEVVDFMLHPQARVGLRHRLVRRVRVTRGEVVFNACCRPRFDYARRRPQASAAGTGVVLDAGEAGGFVLHSSAPLTVEEDGGASAVFSLVAGEEAWFALGELGAPAPSGAQIAESLDLTVQAWRRWADRSTYRGRWREAVGRSALALKLLTSAEHGSIAAAATFGLPEATGAGRNWDYRAAWVRDASFTVYALVRLGYTEELAAFRRWMRGRVDDAPGTSLKVMYALDGGEARAEEELAHLEGYARSRPVRIGNGARRQTQLDIFGEVMDAIYLGNKYGAAIDRAGWTRLRELVEHVRRVWRQPDEGIWEMRGEPAEFLHSRVMCWVALDRAIRLADKRSLPAPLEAWRETRDQISEDVWKTFRHPQHGYFVQKRGGTELDASLLMMPLVRFVSATDPVWLATLDAIGAALTDDSLVFRYRNADGLEGGDGAFCACTFWYVECLARAGRLDEARRIMDRGLGYANALGLFSEELDLEGEPLGNFPQGLTHLAFISAAYFLDRALSDHRTTWQP